MGSGYYVVVLVRVCSVDMFLFIVVGTVTESDMSVGQVAAFLSRVLF